MRIVFSLIFWFAIQITNAQNQNYWSISIPNEYHGKVATVLAKESDIYFFEGLVLKNKIKKGKSLKILISGENPKFYSQKNFQLSNTVFLDNENIASIFEPRNVPIPKLNSYTLYVSIWILLVFLFVVFLKIVNVDVFYGFLMPWMAYSNTEELISKMNNRKIILPMLLFIVTVFGNIWLFFINHLSANVYYDAFLILCLLIFKILILNILEFLLETRGFARAYLIEFLKLAILFSLILFFARLLDLLNPFDFQFVYRILLLLYFITWFIRVLFIFYKERQQKFMHFFSYLCVSEAIPLLILFAFWKS